jgi:hypothetical protein
MHPHPHVMPRKEPSKLRPTSDATLSISAAIRKLQAGHALDEWAGKIVLGLAVPEKAHGISTSWRGVRKIVARLTALGCYVQMQVHANQSFCEVLRVLDGAAVATQLAIAEGAALPEAVTKAAIVACLEMQPQA